MKLSRLTAPVFIAMTLAFTSGYLETHLPWQFERLHIFLFNLTGGGYAIMHYSARGADRSRRTLLFFLLSVCYAIFAFLEFYPAAIVVALVLAGISESVRLQRFSFVPRDFFSPRIPVARKFHHAALLCLSIALVFSALVIINNRYGHWLHYEKLKLNVFFLGFSFPVSLITFSAIFRFVGGKRSRTIGILKDISFWIINLGVIVLFILIIFKQYYPELIVALILFVSVLLVFVFFILYGRRVQQKQFFVSGMFFLLGAAVTGVLYILLQGVVPFTGNTRPFLVIHAYLSLYGWNLTGILVLLRRGDFPLKVNAPGMIALHWFTILVLAPAGKSSPYFAAAAVVCYIIYLLVFFLGRTENRQGAVVPPDSGGIR